MPTRNDAPKPPFDDNCIATKTIAIKHLKLDLLKNNEGAHLGSLTLRDFVFKMIV